MDKKKSNPKNKIAHKVQANYSTIKMLPLQVSAEGRYFTKRPIQLNRFLALILKRNVSTKEAEQEVRTMRVANLATFARKKHGLKLPCVPHKFTDIDGSKCWYGVYSPTPNDKEIIKKVLGGAWQLPDDATMQSNSQNS